MAEEIVTTTEKDKELQVMATINRVMIKELSKLDEGSKLRVMAWLKDRYFKGSNGATE